MTVEETPHFSTQSKENTRRCFLSANRKSASHLCPHPWSLHCLTFFPACNCHRHSFDCYYDPEVDRRRGSLDIHGHYRGGGVCLNCQVSAALCPQHGFLFCVFFWRVRNANVGVTDRSLMLYFCVTICLFLCVFSMTQLE